MINKTSMAYENAPEIETIQISVAGSHCIGTYLLCPLLR